VSENGQKKPMISCDCSWENDGAPEKLKKYLICRHAHNYIIYIYLYIYMYIYMYIYIYVVRRKEGRKEGRKEVHLR